MGFWRKAFGLDLGEVVNDVAEGALTFSVDAESVPPEVFGLTSYASPISPAPRVDRRSAIQCGAVARAHDLVPATLGGLRLQLIDPDLAPTSSTLFEQPERNVPRSVTMTRLFEDMWLEGVGWWQITERGWDGYPTHVKRLRPGRVDVDEDRGVVHVDGKETPSSALIRFDAPSDGLLIKGARAIRACLALETRAATVSDGTPPVDYFVPADGADPADDDEIQEILDQWREARRNGVTGYVPLALEYKTAGWNPEQLQLSEQRDKAVVEVARHAGVDAEDLGVSTTSRTYFNAGDRRKHRVDFTLAKLLIAVTDRLAMGDVTKRGYYPRFNLDELLRSDTKTLYETYEIGLRVGAVTPLEIRAAEGKPPLPELGPVAPVRAISAVPPPAQNRENA